MHIRDTEKIQRKMERDGENTIEKSDRNIDVFTFTHSAMANVVMKISLLFNQVHDISTYRV